MRAPTKTELCNMMIKSWDNISEEIFKKSFRVCGQVKDIKYIEEIVLIQNGRVAEEGKTQLRELLKLDPKDLDYHLLNKLSWLRL